MVFGKKVPDINKGVSGSIFSSGSDSNKRLGQASVYVCSVQMPAGSRNKNRESKMALSCDIGITCSTIITNPLTIAVGTEKVGIEESRRAKHHRLPI